MFIISIFYFDKKVFIFYNKPLIFKLNYEDSLSIKIANKKIQETT